jgi:tRNA dimethylallyltransferase
LTEPLLAVVGPTGSGKTEFALGLCERIGGEIVSADSVQIYRGFDIGSAKPTSAERARVAHHLIDVLDPLDRADAARFVQLAEASIDDIRTRGKRPVLCGGTFLWVRALIYGLAPAPGADPDIRARHQLEARDLGREQLHARLAKVDPKSHQRLSPNDLVRVSRALEVYELTGRPLSELQAEHGFREPRHAALFFGVRRERAELDQRLRGRVQQMFERGWLEEVRGLLDAGLGEAHALGSVGYRQVAEALRSGGEIDREQLIDSIVRATRVLLRRQLTWLRDEPVRWVDPGELGSFVP